MIFLFFCKLACHRYGFAFDNILFLCCRRARLLLHRRGGKAGGQGEHQHHRHDDAEQRTFLHLHNGTDPFLNCVFAKGTVQRAEAAALLLHLQQGHRVGRAVLDSQQPQHHLVAGKLEVAVCQDVHHPDQRVKPVQAERRTQQQLAHAVEPPDVDILVGEDIGQGFGLLLQRLVWQQNGWPAHAVGQRRADAVKLPDANLPAQRHLLLLPLQPLAAKRMLHRQRHIKFPGGPPVADHKIQSQRRRTDSPDQGRRLHRQGDCRLCFFFCLRRLLSWGALLHRWGRTFLTGRRCSDFFCFTGGRIHRRGGRFGCDGRRL